MNSYPAIPQDPVPSTPNPQSRSVGPTPKIAQGEVAGAIRSRLLRMIVNNEQKRKPVASSSGV